MSKFKVVSHKPKNRWDTWRFTIRGIDRETLSLLLNFAEDAYAGLAASADSSSYDWIGAVIERMGVYINHPDGVVRLTPLEVDTHPS
jgi:hypothetical protein